MNRLPVWVWGVAGIAITWLLLRPKAIVSLSGHIIGMALDGAAMGLHQIPKAPGASATVAASVTNNTQDFRGQPVAWPFMVQVSIIDPNTGQSVSVQPSPKGVAPAGGTLTYAATVTVPTSASAGKVYNVRAALFADTSDAAGSPTGVASFITDLTHVSAIVVQPTSGSAVPGGSIGTVDVAQAIMRQMQKR